MTDLQEHGGFGMMKTNVTNDTNALAQAQESKSVQEVQAALIIAQRFPRNQMQAYENIMQSCKRKFLADQALYAYPKGGQTVTGPSIRLAEVLAQNWGNMSFGIREISSGNGHSVVEAYAWDMQTNTQSTKIFQVPHERHTKQGVKKLTDPRDIYEAIANVGARRMRACILAVIPGDITEAATNECEKTMAQTDGTPKEERLRALVDKFNEIDVKVEHIEKRLGHKINATSESEIVELRKIFKSIRDGFAGREAFFDFGQATAIEGPGGLSDLAKNKAKPQLNAPIANAPVDKETGEVYEKK